MANSNIVLSARLLLFCLTEGISVFYFLMSDTEAMRIENASMNPLMVYICYV
jgi:hypothetical protein